MKRTSTLVVGLAATLLLLGIGCDTVVTLDAPTVTTAAIDNGAKLRLSWTAVTDAKDYDIVTDDTTYTTEELSFDVTTPSATIKVYAVNGDDKSDATTIDCQVVETATLVLYGITDPDPNHPSGLAFAADGAASALSLGDANKAALDFVCDDEQASVLPIGLINAGDYGWAQNAKGNAVAVASGTDYDAATIADAPGAYSTQEGIAVSGLYFLWLDPTNNNWDVQDHFAKAKVVSIEDVGGAKKVTLKLGYQKVGGLRWLVN